MRALLLGATGQLGSDIVQHFGDAVELVCMTRSDIDVSNIELIREILGPLDFDTIINCTSYHKTDEVEDNAQLAAAVNMHAVEKMALVCQERNASFVHISTDYVFGGQKSRSPMSEDAPPAPINVYGASKLAGEALANLNCAQTYIIRVASLFGLAGASGKGGNFVETMIRLAKEKDHLNVVDDQLMSPTSTKDVARMLYQLLTDKAPFGIYHCVNTGSATWYEFACEILGQCGLSTPVKPTSSASFPTRAARPPYSALDNSKAAKFAGPIPDWRSALDEYLREKGHV